MAVWGHFLFTLRKGVQLVNKKLSYRRETARQLPTWREGAAKPSSPLWLHLCVIWLNPKATTLSVPSSKRTLKWIGHSRSFKVILIGAGRNPEWSFVVCAFNACVISETYEDTATGKRQIRRFQRPNAGLKMSQQETPSNIYKWFIFARS